MSTPTPQPPPTPPSSPIAAPVSLEELNTLETFGVVLRHIWQEYHWKAPTEKYLGHSTEDRRVVERLDFEQTRIAKPELNAAFCESAIVTVDIELPDGTEVFLHWWIEDQDGQRRIEHPDFSQAHFDANNAKAKVKKARYAWRWDGRLPNDANRPSFLQDGASARSRIQVKTTTGRLIPIGSLDLASIVVKGHPYRIFVVANPKTDIDLQAEKARRNNRWLSSRGNRFQADCWMQVFRGVASPGSEAHVVFLGQGAVEATDVETSTESTSPKWGAIGTPHDTDLKGYFRTAKHGGVTFWLFEMVDETPNPAGPAATRHYEITLPRIAGPTGLLPEPINPFSGVNRAIKNGVHGHQSFSDSNTGFIGEPASVGCTTFLDLSSGTAANPAANRGDLTAFKASYGSWNGAAPANTGTKPWGPPLDGGRPGSFRNKQNYGDAPEDALILDDFDNPRVGPANREPFHLQATVQHAVLGGFLEHEIPQNPLVASDPDSPTPATNPKVRLRIRLNQAPEDSLYWQYHRAAAFGHSMQSSGTYTGELWIPRMIQRLWNGHWRNLQLNGQCSYRWFFEGRCSDGTNSVLAWIGTKPTPVTGWATLSASNIGRYQKSSVPIPAVPNAILGVDVFSVFRYRIRLHPEPKANTSVWEPLSARPDLFTDPARRAHFIDETIVTEGGVQYLVGQSELFLFRPAFGDFGPTPGNGPGTPPGMGPGSPSDPVLA